MRDDSRFTRRRVIRTAAGLSTASLISVAGCTQSSGGGSGSNGPNSTQGSSSGSKAKVDFWSSPNKEELAFHKAAAKQFSKKNSATINPSPVPEGETSEEVVLSALAGGTAPDVFANTFPGFAAQLHANSAAYDLYQIDGVKDFLTNRCGKSTLSQYESPDGGLYQAPWKSNPVLFQYNMSVFKKAGYSKDDLPRTLDELVKVGSKLVNDGIVDVLWDRAPLPTWSERWFDFLPLYLAASQGKKQMFVEKNGNWSPAFNNDTAATVLSFFQDLFKNNLIPKQSGEEPLFPKNKAAINTGGPWVIPYFKSVNKKVNMAHLTPPVPDGVKQNSHTYADPKNTTVFQSSSAPKPAWSFIEFEMGKKWDQRLLQKTLQIPLRKGIVDSADSFFENNPQVKSYAAALDTAYPPEPLPNYQEVMGIFGEEAFVPVVRGNITPQKGLDVAESKIKEKLN